MKLFKIKHEKSYLGVLEAQNIFRFGYKNVTLEDAVSRELEDLESSIKTKSERGKRILSVAYPDSKLDLVERLTEHFKEKGFVVDIYKNPEIKGFVLLIIGW